jgi:hypothetical protein
MTTTLSAMSEVKQERHPTWEVLAAIVGYVSSVEPAIYLVGHHLIGWKKDEIPPCWRISIVAVYGILFLLVGSWTLYRLSSTGVAKDKDASPTDRAVRAMKRHLFLRIIRSLGFVLIYEWLLDRMGVTLYGGFSRYSDWEPRPDLIDRIDRYTLKDESIEFQYSRNHSFIEYRSGRGDDRKYGTAQKLSWRKTPHHWLTFFSWAGFKWTIAHLLFSKGRTEVAS